VCSDRASLRDPVRRVVQLGRLAPLEQRAALGIVPRKDVIRDVVVEDEPSAGQHAADDQSDAEREKLHASIERSIAQSDAGQGIPVEQAIEEIRARRAARARGVVR